MVGITPTKVDKITPENKSETDFNSWRAELRCFPPHANLRLANV